MLVHKHGKKISYLGKKNPNFMFNYWDPFEWEWEWCYLSCQMGSVVSDVFLAEAGNTHRKIPKISPSMYKPFQNNISPPSW